MYRKAKKVGMIIPSERGSKSEVKIKIFCTIL